MAQETTTDRARLFPGAGTTLGDSALREPPVLSPRAAPEQPAGFAPTNSGPGPMPAAVGRPPAGSRPGVQRQRPARRRPAFPTVRTTR